MLTSEQRTHLLAQVEYWDEEQHQTYAASIRAALATIDEQAAEMERRGQEITVLRSAGRVHGYLDEPNASGEMCDCSSCTVWRERFREEART